MNSRSYINKKTGVFSPAASPDPKEILTGLNVLKQMADVVTVSDQPGSPYRYLAQHPEQVYAEWLSFVKQPDVELLIATRGGGGCLYLVNEIRTKFSGEMRKNIIPVGFSDLTTLFWYLWKRYTVTSIYGPVIAYHFANWEKWNTSQQFIELVNGCQFIQLNNFGKLKREDNSGISSDVIDGYIIPACLSVFSEFIDAGDNHENFILILEDVNEKAYKIERYMNLLAYKGFLDKTRVVILGHFLNVDKPEWVIPIFSDFARQYNFILLSGLNFGHQLNSVSLPFGKHGKLDLNSFRLSW